MRKKVENIGWVLFIIAIIGTMGTFGKDFGKKTRKYLVNNKNSKSIEKTILYMSNEISKQTPKRIDDTTILTSTFANKNLLSYVYELDEWNTEVNFDNSIIKRTTLNHWCHGNALELLKQGAQLQYLYLYQKKTISSFKVNLNDCISR